MLRVIIDGLGVCVVRRSFKNTPFTPGIRYQGISFKLGEAFSLRATILGTQRKDNTVQGLSNTKHTRIRNSGIVQKIANI